MRYRVVTTYLMYLLLVPRLAQELKARVVGGTLMAGRLEIFYDGTWNTVCGDSFGEEEASVACRMLGLNSTTAVAVGSYKYGAGSGPILLDDLRCVGNETSLAQCRHRGLYRHDCGHWEDVGVVCNIPEELRARIADEAVEAGRLEIFYHGEWNTVCDDTFGREEAQVACRMLGFNSTEAAAVSSEKYGHGTGRILLLKMECNGNETSLANCKNKVVYISNCDHSHDVGVVCNITEQTTARLINGTSEAGRLEISFNGEWGAVSDKGFGKKEAEVACRMLGFNSAGAEVVSSDRYGKGPGHVLLHVTKCNGMETSLAQCKFAQFYPNAAIHSTDAAVVCNIAEQIVPRLVNGTSDAGRLEILFNREWSTVCNEGFGRKEAQVACTMLGFNGTGAAIVSSDRYGQGSGYILLPTIKCNGAEVNLAQCSHPLFYTSGCDHLQDVSLECNISRVKLRLTGKRRTRFDMGGVEIEIGGKLQTMCISDDKVAAVICRQLGLPSRSAALTEGWSFGSRRGNQLMTNFTCKGDENSISDCDQSLFSNGSTCSDFGVDCRE
ncbi:deleted in malignant brain tumors 1 protein-like isoform X2 [Pomacea canaliculata]|nr:deleted in malignant brain tumors 1 protein-like isoform X2 [Pomacea canaliculata]